MVAERSTAEPSPWLTSGGLVPASGVEGRDWRVYRGLRRFVSIPDLYIVFLGNLAGSGGYFVAMAANKIVAQPGTLWELSQIAQNAWWQKTLYMMPESVHARDEQVVAAADWEKARKAAGEVGADLPPYDKNGAIFKLGPSGSVLGTRPLRLTQRLRRVSHLRRVINELRPL
jgi:hypothetical protein